jgi:hypothetical protein
MSSFQNFFNEDFLLSSTLKPKILNGSLESVAADSNNSDNNTFTPVAISDEKIKVDPSLAKSAVKRVCISPVPPAFEIKGEHGSRTDNLSKSLASHSPRIARSNDIVAKHDTSATYSSTGSYPNVPAAPISVILNTKSPIIPNPPLTNNQNYDLVSAPVLTTSSPPQSLSDQILQVRIKLQIYQKEYAHFVECANRSSLQIQETLEELHRLVNINFDLEPSKAKINNLNNISSLSTSESVDNLPAAIVKSIPASTPKPIVQEEGVQIKSVKHRPRAFPRKPRCLLFNSNQSSYSDLMITSSLDGSVQLWSKNDQKIHSSIYLPSYLHKPFFVEDLCWDRKPTGLLAIGLCESANAPVNDDGNGSSPNRSDRQFAFLKFDNRDPFSAPKFIYSPLTPHDRSITVIENWSSQKHPGDVSNFLTGGLDKAIFSWKVVSHGNGSRDPEITVRELHRRHTSSVQAICYDWNTTDIWSGGTDCRLIQWSGDENRIVNELRWDTRISHLIKSKNHPNLMLATVMSMSSQLRLFDYRMNSILHSFGTQETANLSRYVRPSWHPDGFLIASGTASPADSVGSINIWDIRMLRSNVNNHNSIIKPVKTINCEDRRIVRAEFSPDGRSLVAMSTDGAMTFVEF